MKRPCREYLSRNVSQRWNPMLTIQATRMQPYLGILADMRPVNIFREVHCSPLNCFIVSRVRGTSNWSW